MLLTGGALRKVTSIKHQPFPIFWNPTLQNAGIVAEGVEVFVNEFEHVLRWSPSSLHNFVVDMCI